MSTLPVIGSDGWTGAAEFNDEAVERATKCDQSTKWMNVVALCSSLRDGMSCKIGEKFSVGTQNLVKLVEFEDGTKWIARIPMRQEDDRRATDPETSLRSEIATYKFLKYVRISTHLSKPVRN